MSYRKISIVWKITLWYATFFAGLTFFAATITLKTSDYVMENTIKTQLIDDVLEVIGEIELDDGELEVDDDIDWIKRGTYLSIYQNKRLIDGYVPKRFDQTMEFKLDEVRMVKIGDTTWFLYEKAKEIPSYGRIIVRGLISSDSVLNLHLIYRWLVLCLVPVIFIIAILGGYGLTKRMLRPITEMRRTVEQINSGNDLTKRVNLGKGEDELYKLAHTFDLMFSRLEQSFDREKQFSSDVSHELRTPISVILSQCEYALEQPNEEETKKALESIYKQTIRMSKMIQQLLLLSRGQEAVRKNEFEMICFSELFMMVVEEVKEKASLKGIELKTNISSDIYMRPAS